MRRKTLVGVALAALLCATASADLVTGFENYNGSAQGVGLSGQQGWYLPASSVDHKVYTYAGNVLGIPQNPAGGNQFIAGQSQGATTGYARAQYDIPFAGGTWTFSYDMSGKYAGTLPAQDYLGSFSLQPSATNRYFQSLNIWNDNNNPVAYAANYITNENAVPGVSPGAAWQNLVPDHWYRMSTTINFDTNLYEAVSIQDLSGGGQPVVVHPSGWHLVAGNGQLPTAIRFFAGGDPGGNVMAWDNVSAVIPEPASILLLGLAALLRRR